MKHFIKNSKNEDICVQISEAVTNISHLKMAIICHGITGYKEQDVILQTVKTLNNCGYDVVTFDCRNSRGESYNNHSCATVSSMYDDIQTVINWLKLQNFYIEPFLLVGHSLGGSVVLNFAEQNPNKVESLILLSSIFDENELSQNTQKSSPEFFQQLQNGGIIRRRNNIDCYLDNTYLQDLQNYNFYASIQNLNMPVLIVTGDQDIASTQKDNERFYKCLNCKKELFILQNCSHIYDMPQNQSDLNDKITKFIIY
jgi:putative redox protein